MVQMKEEPLENVMRRQKERNDRDILKAFYEPVWRKVIPENGLWEAQDVGVKLFTQGLPRGALSIALPDGLEDWTKAEISRFKVVLQRPDLKTKTYPLIFNSELEYGKLFLFRTVNHQIISYDEKVDPKLDILAMADPKTGARFVLTACETTFGGDKSKSVLQLYLSKPGMKNEGFCFPIQLTKSPNMVRHAMDLYLEGKRIAPSRNLASIEPLAYGEPPFTIKKNIGGSNYHAVVNNADEYLIEFDGDGDIKTDHKDRYLTERARKIPRLIRKPVEVHEYPRDPFAIVPDDSKTKNTEEDPK